MDHGGVPPRAQNDEGGQSIAPNEAQRVQRIERPQHLGVFGNVGDTQHGNAEKPGQRDRSEKFADIGRASLLHGKQAKQNQQGQRDYGFGKAARHHLQTLHG
ncbi:hypothetical protein GALL_539770 [mine drainage metagenome]|uniref:Uncharacterized protein n=1 Tax=mine drainage metagenome TaxID=410659 RepID=A0A1J5P1K7_9ZZZZ